MADDPNQEDEVENDIPEEEQSDLPEETQQGEGKSVVDRALDTKDTYDKTKDKIEQAKELGKDIKEHFQQKSGKSKALKQTGQTPGDPSGASRALDKAIKPPTPTTAGTSTATGGTTAAGAGTGAAGTSVAGTAGTSVAGTAGAGAAGTGVAAGGGAAGGAAAGGAASGAAAAGAGAAGGIGVLGVILVVIVIIILLVGMIIALIYLPGSLTGLVKGFFKNIAVYFMGEDWGIDDKDYAEVANYIQDRGYDLYAEGYINQKLNPETDIDDSGKIIKIPKAFNHKTFPNLLELYTRMNAYTYRVRNKAAARFFVNEDMSGFLNFRLGTFENNSLVSEKQFFQGVFREAIKVNHKSETLEIKKHIFGGTHNYYMDGWSGRYGLPLELFMAIHQGTRAPDLTREIAKGTRAFTTQKFEEGTESIKYVSGTGLYYKKPLLNILLLETELKLTVNFMVPDTSTVNGQVYVLKEELDFNAEYEYNPFNFTEDDFELKSAIAPAELYKSFFKGPNGQFIRIKPKKPNNIGLNFDDGTRIILNNMPRTDDGVLVPSPVSVSEKTEKVNGENVTKTRYKVVEEGYDLSSFYFVADGGTFKVLDQRGAVIDSNGMRQTIFVELDRLRFLDQYGLYGAVQEAVNINSTIPGYWSFVDRVREAYSETENIKTYIPLLKNSEGHWFRDIYFYLDAQQPYVVEDKDYFLLTGEKWAEYNITEEEGKKILTPKLFGENNAWQAYEIKKTDNIASLGEPMKTDDPKYDGVSRYLYFHESSSVVATQKQEGRRGMTNPRTKNLFANVPWYKYDGSVATADRIYAERFIPEAVQNNDLKSLIEPDNDLMAAFEILEGSKSLDSQYILRDLKELYVELGYFEKEDLRDPVRRILKWPLGKYKTPKMWPAADIHQDPEGYGVFIPSKTTLEKVYDEKTLKDNKDVVGKGFEPDEQVVSPVTGRIEEIGTKDVTRLVTDKDGILRRVTYNNVGYITISAIDETAPSEAAPYKKFYDTEYKGVISGKVKHGKQGTDSRYLEGNKITIEGINVEFPENINDKSNSRYVRQLKSSAIKKVQTQQARDEAEKNELDKKNAPNFIPISGAEQYVGNYIKEGTVIGKTTESDVRIIMRDSDKAFIENVDHYIVMNLGFYVQIMDDYYTKAEEGEPNVVDDVEMFRYMFEGYPLLQENAQVFLDMQEKYQVNAVFAAAVAIQECGAGNATQGANHAIREKFGGTHNNIFSIKGSSTANVFQADYGEGMADWNVYPDVAAACDHFARLISQNSSGNYWAANDYYVNEIAPTYCNPEWGIRVNSHMTRALQKALIKMGGSPYAMGSEMYQRLMEEAEKHLGKDYEFGASGPVTFDCSSYVCWVYRESGVKPDLYRVGARRLYDMSIRLDRSEAQPGDMVFFTKTYDNLDGATHVGIYMGDGMMIHAGDPINITTIDTPYWRDHFYGFGRFPEFN